MEHLSIESKTQQKPKQKIQSPELSQTKQNKLRSKGIPTDWVNLSSHAPQIKIEMMYASSWNFTGTVAPAYHKNICYLKKDAAKALSMAQKQLKKHNLGLVVFDCYRPQQAIDYFVQWSKNTDKRMKSKFYPKVSKHSLLKEGYLSSRSSHNSGYTVDLSLITLNHPNNTDHPKFEDCRTTQAKTDFPYLDMGTYYDCFSPLSNTHHPDINKAAADNRQLLKNTLESVGFKNYSKEWWHFKYEPAAKTKQTYDFVIE